MLVNVVPEPIIHVAMNLRRRIDAKPGRREQLQSLDTPEQWRLVEELRADMSEIVNRRLRSADAVESPWWTRIRSQITRAVMHEDPRAFLRWAPIGNTMFVAPRTRYIGVELATLQGSADWDTRWQSALIEDNSGCPPLDSRLPESSGNLIHHGHYVHVLEQTLSTRLETFEEIVEFGGGYGGLARLAYRLGFQGKYRVYDFPEFGAIQRYYMKSVADVRQTPDFGAGFVATTDLEQATEISGSSSLFAAFWSLSETPPSEREPWVQKMPRFTNLFFAYQHAFEQADNRRWFAELAERLPQYHWQTWEIPHQPGSSYVVASRAAG